MLNSSPSIHRFAHRLTSPRPDLRASPDLPLFDSLSALRRGHPCSIRRPASPAHLVRSFNRTNRQTRRRVNPRSIRRPASPAHLVRSFNRTNRQTRRRVNPRSIRRPASPAHLVRSFNRTNRQTHFAAKSMLDSPPSSPGPPGPLIQSHESPGVLRFAQSLRSPGLPDRRARRRA